MTVPVLVDHDADTLRHLLHDPDPRASERLLARLQPALSVRYPDPAVRTEQSISIARYLRFLDDQGASRTHPGESFLQYVHHIEATNKPASVSNQLSSIRAFYRTLKDLAVLDPTLDPTGGYKHRVQTQPPCPPYPEDDVRLLLTHASSPYVRAALLCCIDAGLYGQPLMNLTWEDIDRERGVLLSSRGEVPLTAELHQALELHSAGYGGRLAEGPVFPNHQFSAALRRLLWQASRDARVPYRTWQALYTTHALRVLRTVPDTETRMRRLFLETERALERYLHLLADHAA